MTSETECQPLHLEEYTSSYKSCVIYYHILRLAGSAYVWVGTEAGEQGSVVAALTSRVAGLSAPVSTLIGGATQEPSAACASRLQLKLGFPLVLSLNIADDQQLLEHTEKFLLEKLS